MLKFSRLSHLYTQNKGGYGAWVPMSSDPNGIPGQPGFVAGMYTAPTFVAHDQAGNPQPPLPGDDTGSYFERRMAPIGQGFIITGQATSGLDASNNQLIIKNSHRRYFQEGLANNSQFRGPSGVIGVDIGTDGTDPAPTYENPLKYMRIYTSFGDTHFRDMVLAFDGKYGTDGFDRGYDARHPVDASSADAFFPVTVGDVQEMFVIQTVDYDGEKHVPIRFNVATQTNLEVEVVEENNLPFEEAYLFDSENNTYQQITGGSKASVTLATGDYATRFFIVFKSQRQAVEESAGTRAQEEAVASMDFFQNNRVGQLEVGNPEGYDIASANIFDMGGRLVVSKVNLGSSRSFTFPTSNLSDGVYLVKLLTNENFAIDHKITVYNNK